MYSYVPFAFLIYSQALSFWSYVYITKQCLIFEYNRLYVHIKVPRYWRSVLAKWSFRNPLYILFCFVLFTTTILGTDASIPTHIKNVQERNYVDVCGPSGPNGERGQVIRPQVFFGKGMCLLICDAHFFFIIIYSLLIKIIAFDNNVKVELY